MLSCVIGYILFFVPGLYYASHYYFSGLPLLAQDTQSIKEDAELAYTICKGLAWQMVFVFLVHTAAIALLFTRIGFFISVLFLIPVISLIEVHLYYTLKASSK